MGLKVLDLNAGMAGMASILIGGFATGFFVFL